MSYDVCIADEDFNYTYNVGHLFYDHFDGDKGLNTINGMTGRKAAQEIAIALSRIARTRNEHWTENDVGERRFCSKYDPPNGWGSTVGGILFLALLMAACMRNPRKIVRVS